MGTKVLTDSVLGSRGKCGVRTVKADITVSGRPKGRHGAPITKAELSLTEQEPRKNKILIRKFLNWAGILVVRAWITNVRRRVELSLQTIMTAKFAKPKLT